MTVSRRLLIVALLCLLPSVAAGLFTQFDLQSRRTTELGELAMRQAEFAQVDIAGAIDAARQLGLIAMRFPDVARLQPDCGRQLMAVHSAMPRYAFVAAYRRDGTLACSSIPMSDVANPPWLTEIAGDGRPDVGTLSHRGRSCRSGCRSRTRRAPAAARW